MSTIMDIGIPAVGSGILQPKQQHKWRVTFANLGGGTDSQPLSMQAISITKPKLTFAKIELHRYNSISYIAGKHSWDPLNLVLEDDVTGSASAVLMAQLQKQQWLIGAEGQWLASAGEASLYKFVTLIDQLDGNDSFIERWTVEGCWFDTVNYGSLAYANGDAVTVETTLVFDHARLSIGGYNQGRGIATGGKGA